MPQPAPMAATEAKAHERGSEPWRYATAADLDASPIERLRRVPREPDMLLCALRWMTETLVRLWLRLYHRFSTTGVDRLPVSGSFIMVCNHASHLDALCLRAALPMRRLDRAFAAAAEDYFFTTPLGAIFAVLSANAVPFGRRRRVRTSLTGCSRLLAEDGVVLMIFPEGTRSKDGALGPFKPGVAMLALETGVPVVPCYLEGAAAAWPKGARWPRPRRVCLHIGPPLGWTAATAQAPASHREALTRICNELRREIERLAVEATGGVPAGAPREESAT